MSFFYLSTLIGGIVALIVYSSSCFFSWLDGKKDERLEDAEQTLEDISTCKQIEDEVSSLPDGAAFNELRNEWSKK